MKDHPPPLVLGIETSCDDTAAALVDGDGRVLSSIVASQLAAHRPFGGVVPEIASREHLSNWRPVLDSLLEPLGASLAEIDVVAATRGPGLLGSLLVGLSLGKAIAYGLARPFYAVHHLEGHLFSPFLDPQGGVAEEAPERFLGLVVSGGHSSLFSVRDGAVEETLAETRDDAMGEVFDKVGRRLGLPYPQGPQVDALAEEGDPGGCPMPVPRCSDDSLDLSYSGLKSRALLELSRLAEAGVVVEQGCGRRPPQVLDVLAGFRAAAVAQLIDRLERLQERRPLGLVAVSGGAAANRLLRRELVRWAEQRDVALRLVPLRFSGDNAAMIAHAALLRHHRGEPPDPWSAEAESRIPL